MAKVTATDGNGNDVPVIQAQFNNLGQVESFLTQLPNGHQKWVFASEYNVSVDEASEQPDILPGVMTKTSTLKPSEIVTKSDELVPPADPVEPAVPSEPAKPKLGVHENTEPVIDDEVVDGDGPLDPGIISEGDLDGPVPTAPILDIPEDELTPPPAEPTTPAPVEPVTPAPTPPVKPAASNSKPVKPTAPKPTKPAAK